MKFIARTIFCTALIVTSGCVSLLPETAPAKPRYEINAVNGDVEAGDTVGWSLVVDDPRTTRAFDTTKIAVSTQPGKLQYYAGAEWADRAPRLFQTALIQSFEDSARILSVGDRGAIPIGEFVLQTDIRKMQLNVRGGESSIVVSIYGRLTDGRGKIFAARKFDATQAAASDKADDVIAAFDAAFDSAIMELVNWTFEEGEHVSALGA